MLKFAVTDPQNDRLSAVPPPKNGNGKGIKTSSISEKNCSFLFLPGNSCHKIIELFGTAGLPFLRSKSSGRDFSTPDLESCRSQAGMQEVKLWSDET
jgi:hypothetical protein